MALTPEKKAQMDSLLGRTSVSSGTSTVLTPERKSEMDRLLGKTSSLAPVQTPQEKPSILKRIGSALISSEKNFGESIAGAIIAPQIQKNLNESNKQKQDIASNVVSQIKLFKSQGKDTSRLEKAYSDLMGTNIPGIADIIPSVNKTAGQVFGEGAGVGLDILTAGTYGNAGKGFELAEKTAKTTGIAKKTNVGKEVLKGAGVGYGYDVTGGLQEGNGVGSFAPGVGTITGGVLGGAGAAIGNKLISNTATKEAKLVKSFDDTVGQILQGDKKDREIIKDVLTGLDTKEIKTYQDLVDRLDEKVKTWSGKQDQILESDTLPRLIDNLDLTTKVGNETVSHNYVKDAIFELYDHYKATNDVIGMKNIESLAKKADEVGLTIKELNDIARQHGENLSAFNVNGELASGLKKQAVENTRKGLKSTVRELFGNPVSKEIDNQIFKTIRARDLAQEMVEKVNTLQQKIQQRSIGGKAGYLLGKLINLIGLGSPKGIVEAMLPRGQGLKTLNALDLEQVLSKNLKLINNISKENIAERELEKNISELLRNLGDKSPFLSLPERATPNKQGGFISTGSKDLQPLYKEAQKYKSADEFVKDVSTSEIRYKLRTGLDKVAKETDVKSLTGKQKVGEETVAYWKGRINENIMSPGTTGTEGFAPIIVDGNKIVDGFHKLQAYKELGFGKVPTISKSQLEQIWKEANGKVGTKQGMSAVNPLTVIGGGSAMAAYVASLLKDKNK